MGSALTLGILAADCDIISLVLQFVRPVGFLQEHRPCGCQALNWKLYILSLEGHRALPAPPGVKKKVHANVENSK